MRYALMLLTAGLFLVLVRLHPAQAQFEVVEVGGVLLNSGWTVLNTAATVIETAVTAANTTTDLISIGVSALEDFTAVVDELEGIMRDAQILMWDIRTIETQTALLFDLKTAPNNSTDLQARLLEIRRAQSEILLAARRVQTIVRSAQDALHRLVSIWTRIENLAGNKAAQQNLNDGIVQLNATAVQQAAATTAYQQAMLMDKQAEPLIEESLSRINHETLATMPRPKAVQ